MLKLNDIKPSVSKLRESRSIYLLKKNLQNRDFTIISNDCWGGELYRYLNIPYKTPFVGLMMSPSCYIKLVEALPFYLKSDLKFIKNSRYEHIENYKIKIRKDFPIGLLNDVELHFLHYNSPEEAKEKWTRRLQRVNWNKIFIKYTNTLESYNFQIIKRIDNLNYPRISFNKISNNNIPTLVKIDDWNDDAAKLFYNSLRNFNVIEWLNGNTGKVSKLDIMNYWLFHKKNLLSLR